MEYSPKLKKAMEEIKKVLKKYDIAGFVLLHTPGHTEYLNRIDPGYSCVSVEGGAFRIKLKADELPGGKEQARKLAEDTYNMVTLMADVLAMHASGFIDLHELLKEKWGGEEGPAGHTSHEQQNN